MFYNSNTESGAELRKSKVKAGKQDDLILDFFKERPGQRFSPYEVHRNLFTEAVPETSTRRAITTLTNGLFLEKTDMMVMGNYGKPVHTWTLRTGNNNQLKLI